MVARTSFVTPDRHGYSVRFSPFQPNYLGVATSEEFGLRGGGTLYLLELTVGRRLIELSRCTWSDALFDCTWSECDLMVMVTASGDNSLQIWNFTTSSLPIKFLHGHTKEVHSVDWAKPQINSLIVSASWDCTLKVWDPLRSACLNTYYGHRDIVYNAMWSPHIPNCFASVSSDGTLRLWNLFNPQNARAICNAHNGEALSCSWCKGNENIIATGGSDNLVKVWDIRNLVDPVSCLTGCTCSLRRVMFSPHSSSMIAGVSYDYSTRIWDYNCHPEPIQIVEHHSDFVYGLDWNPHVTGEMADCGWDSMVHVFSPLLTRGRL